jgi:hypothetical protein
MSPVDLRSAKVARLGRLQGELNNLQAQVDLKSLPKQLTSIREDLTKLADKLGEADKVRAREDNETQTQLDKWLLYQVLRRLQ